MVTQVVEPKEEEKKALEMDQISGMKMNQHEHNNHMKSKPSSSPMPSTKSLSPVPGGPSPMNGIRPAPIMTNLSPSRPPSSASVHSSSSGPPGAPSRTTATSRRGGRTRCRSPPIMVNRPGSIGHAESYPPVDDRGAAPPPSPANPSAAAAAAAAAAKSLSNTRTGPPPSSWQYEGTDRGPIGGGNPRDYGRRSHRNSRYLPHHPPPSASSSRHLPHRSGYFDPRSGGSGWGAEDDGRPPSRSSTSRYGQQPPPSGQRRDDHYGYRGSNPHDYGYRGGRGSRSDLRHHYNNDDGYDRRYPSHPSSQQRHPYGDHMSRREQERPPHYGGDPFRGREAHHRRDAGYYKGGMPPNSGVRVEGGASMVKRTTRVIGTATPIHVPRASEQGIPPPNRGAASVFRGRSGGDLGPSRANPEESGPQKILMSIRTPSTSFEEKPASSSKPSRRTPTSNDPNQDLSPQDPPQIQHSHHQSATDSSLFFEPTRSPKSQTSDGAGPPQPTSSLDMAPSFSLFNQSFDSLGDTAGFFNVGGPLDSALQSTSFGAGLGGSDDKGNDLQLHGSSSGGNSFSQQLLGGPGSGALNGTFGMSPSNSFGNGPSSRSSNMMVLGGEQNGSSSPSQVLDMYQSSYTGGDSSKAKERPTDAGHSMRGPSMGNNVYVNTSSFGQAPLSGHMRGPSTGGPENADGGPNFYFFLKRNKDAFKECLFLLPGLKAALLETPQNVKKEESEDTSKRHTRSQYREPSPHDSAIASRRVASAVCAFGGTFIGDRKPQQQPQQLAKTSSQSQSIFREKSDETPAVTPSSSTSSPPNRHDVPQSKYDDMLPGRYYENDNRLSWEFEEKPPIETTFEEKEEEAKSETKREDISKDNGGDESGEKGEADAEESSVTTDKVGERSGSVQSDTPKMRYRCKLCGQPKQNHTCPYRMSLARSIGVMIYPSVNAFTSIEPGALAPPLSEMNNFIESSGESFSTTDTSPSRPTPDRLRRMNAATIPSSAQVTPESLRNGRQANSPISVSTTPQRPIRTPVSANRSGMRSHNRYMRSTSPGSARKKRTHSQMVGEDQGDLLFVEAADLKPEQFRIIAHSEVLSKPNAFTYPALPLPYAQRKRLSDNLFSLSKEVPKLTDECAAVLREARERDMWDLAVAELMTQVVIVAHCHDGDDRFEGLRRYLLNLGISC